MSYVYVIDIRKLCLISNRFTDFEKGKVLLMSDNFNDLRSEKLLVMWNKVLDFKKGDND